MSEQTYKKFDSQSEYNIWNARLVKVETREGEKGPMVRLTFVDTRRSERYSEMWMEANVNDFQAQLASYLQKGDVLGIKGALGLRRYGDENEKFAIEVIRAQIFPSVDLFMQLKERGFTPGESGEKPTAKKGGKVPPKGKAAPPKKKIVQIPDDDEDEE